MYGSLIIVNGNIFCAVFTVSMFRENHFLVVLEDYENIPTAKVSD